ncbi:hypothetical protein O4H62_21795 [Hoeflea alexandrii]|nr:hypothetical protein [Hoeflea alexandrii]
MPDLPPILRTGIQRLRIAEIVGPAAPRQFRNVSYAFTICGGDGFQDQVRCANDTNGLSFARERMHSHIDLDVGSADIAMIGGFQMLAVKVGKVGDIRAHAGKYRPLC